MAINHQVINSIIMPDKKLISAFAIKNLIKELDIMQYTFEITIAGCNTRCAHCCVNGGQDKIMPFDDYITALSKLKSALKDFKKTAWITLGDEIFNHPNIEKMMKHTQQQVPQFYGYPKYGVPTSAIALWSRPDKEQILDSIKKTGVNLFMLTLHGAKDNHNKITQNPLSFDCLVDTANWLKSQGITVAINLMLSKALINDWDKIESFISQFKTLEITIPFYLPIQRLKDFQKYRADYDDCQRLKSKLNRLGLDEQSFFMLVEENNQSAIRRKFDNCSAFDYSAQEKKSTNWVFFNITQNLDIYYGNKGVPTKLLGNLKSMSAAALSHAITSQPANLDWSAFYNLDSLPSIKELLFKTKDSDLNLVYPSANDCLYAWLDQINTPTIIIK